MEACGDAGCHLVHSHFGSSLLVCSTGGRFRNLHLFSRPKEPSWRRSPLAARRTAFRKTLRTCHAGSSILRLTAPFSPVGSPVGIVRSPDNPLVDCLMPHDPQTHVQLLTEIRQLHQSTAGWYLGPQNFDADTQQGVADLLMQLTLTMSKMEAADDKSAFLTDCEIFSFRWSAIRQEIAASTTRQGIAAVADAIVVCQDTDVDSSSGTMDSEDMFGPKKKRTKVTVKKEAVVAKPVKEEFAGKKVTVKTREVARPLKKEFVAKKGETVADTEAVVEAEKKAEAVDPTKKKEKKVKRCPASASSTLVKRPSQSEDAGNTSASSKGAAKAAKQKKTKKSDKAAPHVLKKAQKKKASTRKLGDK